MRRRWLCPKGMRRKLWIMHTLASLFSVFEIHIRNGSSVEILEYNQECLLILQMPQTHGLSNEMSNRINLFRVIH